MKIDSVPIRDLSGGIVQKIGDELTPNNIVNFAQNLRFDKVIGRAVVRGGTDLVGAQITASQEILGLHQFIKSNGTKYFLAVINGASTSALYRLITATWTSESVAKAKNVKHRFLTYLDVVMALDGTNVYGSTDGDTWVTTGTALDLGNCPAGKYPIEWNDRVYVAGMTANPDRLQYTSTPTDYIVSWTGAGSGYIDIEPYEGQGAITGLGKVPGYLLIFKERVLKRWNGASTFPDDLCNFGTSSHESIVLGKRTAYFFSSGYAESIGFYETNGEETRKISRPIQGIVEAISSSNYSKVAGFSNGEMVMWSIGDITWESVAYNNAVVMYHFDSQSWTLMTFPSEYRVFSPYIDANGNLKICAGDDNGQIIDIFKAATTTDKVTGVDPAAITYALQYHPMDLGSRSLMKEITKIIPHTENLTGAVLSYKIDKTGSYASFGTVTANYTDEFIGRIAGHAFEFRWSGTASAGGEIIGFDIVTPEVAMSIKY